METSQHSSKIKHAHRLNLPPSKKIYSDRIIREPLRFVEIRDGRFFVGLERVGSNPR
jgi:hypothetical protein